MTESVMELDQAGSQIWYKKDDRTCIHRDNGPAIIWDDGAQFWYQNGVNHREDGPSSIYANGDIRWSDKGRNLDFDVWCEIIGKSSEDILVLKLKYGI